MHLKDVNELNVFKVHKKETSITSFTPFPANIYLFKVNNTTLEKDVKYVQSYNKNTRTTSVILIAGF